MNWLSLTPLEFTALFSGAAAGAVWLYLIHQRPRHKRVSTLRFWQSLEAHAPSRRRRRIREPWSLVAQLLFLLLAILALANPRWGAESAEPRHVALVVDTSIWAQAQPPGETPWMERIQAEARRVVDRLPPGDRVLLLRAEADAAPAVAFTENRAALRRALAQLRPSDTVADLPRAFEAAQSALAGKRRSAIVYVGTALIDPAQRQRLHQFRQALERKKNIPRPQFIMRVVEGAAARAGAPERNAPGGGALDIDNRGITQMALRRDPAQPDRWHLLVQVKNYGSRAVPARLKLSVGGRVIQQQAIALAAAETKAARADFTWAQGGLLEADLEPADLLAVDNRAVAHLPAFRPVSVAVFSADPRALRPALSASPYLRCEFLPPQGTPAARPQVAIYDGGPPSGAPAADNLILFLRGGAPATGSATSPSAPRVSRQIRLTAWNAQHPVTRWVRTRDISVQSAASIRPLPSDTVLAWAGQASAGAGAQADVPLVLAREESGRKTVIVAFDPRQSNLPLQPAFPLLLAGAIEWMTGAVEETSEPAATGEVVLPADGEEYSLRGAGGPEPSLGSRTRVYSPAGEEIPAARKGDEIHLLAYQAGLYRITSDRSNAPERRQTGANAPERRVAVNVPPLPAERWKFEAAERAALDPAVFTAAGSDLWRWLLLLAIVPLWAEWWSFYPRRKAASP